MAVETQVFSGAHGTAGSTGNTGYTSLITTGGSFAFDNAWQPRGIAAALKGTGSTANGGLYGQRSFTATDVLAYDQPIKPLVLPGGELNILFFSTNGSTRSMAVTVLADGSVRIRDAANTAIWTSAAGALAVGVGCVLSVYFTRHASAAQIRVAVFEEDGVTVRADSTLLTGRNTGSAAVAFVRSSAAKGGTSTSAAAYLFGEPRMDRAATGLIPAPVGPAPYRPFRMWLGGAYVPVLLRRWTGSGYGLLQQNQL